jgi:excisionase family DNA binding protein
MESEEPLWNVQEVAAYLRMSTKWVYRFASTGRLPCCHVGGARRFDPRTIRAWARGTEDPGPVGLTIRPVSPTR